MISKIIDIDAQSLLTVLDFYDEMLKQIDAPEWHGRNVNALVDSMVYGGINKLQPPYVLKLHHVDKVPHDVLEEIRFAMQTIVEARMEQREANGVDVDVGIEIVSD